jgi:predicted membrane protein
MIRPVLTYCAAFLTGAAVWLAVKVVHAINPFLNWEYPFLRLFIGMTFPGGAPLSLHFLSHAAQTWVPFLAAFLVSYALTSYKARFSGAVAMYVAFLIWSWGMVILHTFGLAQQAIFAIGFAGTFLGGLGLYLRLVSPVRSE